MIKFFSKIRQDTLSEGKSIRYLKYAIGEIVLVVIGILIALQINNWNEQRKIRIAEKDLYLNIIEDLDKELAVLEDQIRYSELLKNSFRNIHEYTSGKTDSLNLEYPSLLFQSFNFSSLLIQNHENSVDKISVDSLRSQLNEYLLVAKELSTRRGEEVDGIKTLRRPFLMQNKIIEIDKILYDNTESASINLEAFMNARDSDQYEYFIASGYASNQALIFFTNNLIDLNRALKYNLENSDLLNND